MGFRKLINGFKQFQTEYFDKDPDLYNRLVNDGQSPKVMVIACSDSRIDPAILTKSEPGDIFSVRNIAAMVSPDDDSDHRGHGTAAAVEYAVKVLKVQHIVILGHALCGGIHALASSGEDLEQDNGFIARWISIGADARNKVRQVFPEKTVNEHSQILEKTSLLVSINNLMSYSWLREAVENGQLKLHAWYFDMPNGALLNYNPTTNTFEDVLSQSVSAAMSDVSIDQDAAISLMDYLNNVKENLATEKKQCPSCETGSQAGYANQSSELLQKAV